MLYQTLLYVAATSISARPFLDRLADLARNEPTANRASSRTTSNCCLPCHICQRSILGPCSTGSPKEPKTPWNPWSHMSTNSGSTSSPKRTGACTAKQHARTMTFKVGTTDSTWRPIPAPQATWTRGSSNWSQEVISSPTPPFPGPTGSPTPPLPFPGPMGSWLRFSAPPPFPGPMGSRLRPGYPELLQNANVPGIKIMVLRYLAIELFKCIKGINPAYLNAMFTCKECPYALRDSSILVRLKVKLTQYSLKSFKSYGAKIWDILPTSYKTDISLDEFKTLIKSWDGPKCKCSVRDLYT